ncbi:MAG: hypothetical protein KDD40_03385 [Bdellovibrionales bacterium]|nr:hypothetical protein [Bdellovibrionales bacterium]
MVKKCILVTMLIASQLSSVVVCADASTRYRVKKDLDLRAAAQDLGVGTFEVLSILNRIKMSVAEATANPNRALLLCIRNQIFDQNQLDTLVERGYLIRVEPDMAQEFTTEVYIDQPRGTNEIYYEQRLTDVIFMDGVKRGIKGFRTGVSGVIHLDNVQIVSGAFNLATGIVEAGAGICLAILEGVLGGRERPR